IRRRAAFASALLRGGCRAGYASDALAVRRYLENRRLGVRTEDRLQRADDLALGAMRAGGVEQQRHEVVPRIGGGVAQRRERALGGAVVARAARPVQALDLLALERRVDAQDRDPVALVALGEGVDADDLAAPLVDLLLEAEARLGDLALRVVALDRLDHAA